MNKNDLSQIIMPKYVQVYLYMLINATAKFHKRFLLELYLIIFSNIQIF